MFADLIRKPKSARLLLENAAKDGKFTDKTVRKKAQEIFQVVLQVTECNVDLDDSHQSCSRVMQPAIDTRVDDVELSDILEVIDYLPQAPTFGRLGLPDRHFDDRIVTKEAQGGNIRMTKYHEVLPKQYADILRHFWRAFVMS
jgi:hypothetical protein